MERTTALTAASASPAMRFAALLVCWATAGFVLLRSPWLQAHIILPFANWQAAVASWYLGATALPVSMAPDCSGLDVMALCAGATLSYPAPPLRRVLAAAGGVTLLLLLNIVRIASLGLTVPLAGFGVLHEYVWPTVLMLAAIAYVGGWLWHLERAGRNTLPAGAMRFARAAAILIALYMIAIPILAASGVLDVYAGDVARSAAAVLRFTGMDAAVEGRVLRAGGIRYLITSECVTTPLLPLYVAAVLAAPWRRSLRAAAVCAAVPLFAVLSVIRLVTLAVPALINGSPLPVTHAFHQLLLGACILAGTAAVEPGATAVARARRACLGLAVALAVGIAGGALYLRSLGIAFPAALHDPADVQGALVMLPAFQMALLGGLAFILRGWRDRRAWIAAAMALAVSHAALLAVAPQLRSFASPDALAVFWRFLAVVMPAGAAAVICHRRGR